MHVAVGRIFAPLCNGRQRYWSLARFLRRIYIPYKAGARPHLGVAVGIYNHPSCQHASLVVIEAFPGKRSCSTLSWKVNDETILRHGHISGCKEDVQTRNGIHSGSQYREQKFFVLFRGRYAPPCCRARPCAMAARIIHRVLIAMP